MSQELSMTCGFRLEIDSRSSWAIELGSTAFASIKDGVSVLSGEGAMHTRSRSSTTMAGD